MQKTGVIDMLCVGDIFLTLVPAHVHRFGFAALQRYARSSFRRHKYDLGTWEHRQPMLTDTVGQPGKLATRVLGGAIVQ
jgi:hypothetical protein